MIRDHEQYNLGGADSSQNSFGNDATNSTSIQDFSSISQSPGIYDAPNILALQKALSIGIGDLTTTIDPALGLLLKNMRTNLTSQYYIYNSRQSSIASIQDFTLIDVADKTHKWPNQSGTIAMTTDIPSNVIASGATGTTVFNNYALVAGPKADNLTLQDLGTTGNANQILTSQGGGVLPIWQTGAILSGATNTTVYTPYAVVLGPKADNLSLQDVGALGTEGQVLTSNGAGQIPIWQAGGATTTSVTSSTFTFNGTGSPGTSSSVAINYQKLNKWVTLNVPGVTATSGTNSSQFNANSAIDAAFRPTINQICQMNTTDNGGAVSTSGIVVVQTNGILSIRRDYPGNNYTNSSVCGSADGFNITYYIG